MQHHTQPDKDITRGFYTDVAQCRRTLKLRRGETREVRRLGGITFYRNDLMVIKLTDAWVERRESRLDVEKNLCTFTQVHTGLAPFYTRQDKSQRKSFMSEIQVIK